MKINQFSKDFESLLDPLSGGADDDEECAKYGDVDCNNEEQIKSVIRDRLIPSFNVLSYDKKIKLISEMRNHLSNKESDFDRLFYAGLPPIDAPNNPRLFFVWLLDEMLVALNLRQ